MRWSGPHRMLQLQQHKRTHMRWSGPHRMLQQAPLWCYQRTHRNSNNSLMLCYQRTHRNINNSLMLCYQRTHRNSNNSLMLCYQRTHRNSNNSLMLCYQRTHRNINNSLMLFRCEGYRRHSGTKGPNWTWIETIITHWCHWGVKGTDVTQVLEVRTEPGSYLCSTLACTSQWLLSSVDHKNCTAVTGD